MPDPLRPPLPPPGASGGLGAWRARLDDIADRLGISTRRLVAAGLVVPLLVVALVAVVRPGRAESEPPADLPRISVSTSAVASATSRPESIVVDVAGAVIRPGVHRIPFGSRAADAIAAAGGAASDADLTRVNQARVLSDGEQVRVPRVGEPAPPASVDASGAGAGAAQGGGPVDLNAATAEQLDGLPGIGPATASAIVEWRDRNGPFRSVDDLLDVPGIGPSKLERLRPLVTV